ncbi:hypothetical protein OG381_03830 [Streptomyces sp. NBC_00490]|uniref:hypothetical protein n=1 Tax=Streptomyces sp. NBC_00490 TaxID=2903657 RepID=UPI002E1912B3
MTALMWLLIPLVTCVLAGIWAWCGGRPADRDLWTDVDRYDRLRAAHARMRTAAPEHGA